MVLKGWQVPLIRSSRFSLSFVEVFLRKGPKGRFVIYVPGVKFASSRDESSRCQIPLLLRRRELKELLRKESQTNLSLYVATVLKVGYSRKIKCCLILARPRIKKEKLEKRRKRGEREEKKMSFTFPT